MGSLMANLGEEGADPLNRPEVIAKRSGREQGKGTFVRPP
jgi:hypothetical protein